jgi:hypothetical protein
VMLLARSFTVVCCHIIDQKALNVELGDLYWGRLLLKKHCFLEKISRIMWMKRPFLWHIITRSLFKKHYFLDKIWPRGSQWWTWWSFSRLKKHRLLEKI